jgi:hypothetical protein
MNTIRALLLTALGLTCLATAADRPPQPLYNGRDLQGWVQRGGKASYKSEDGQIVGRTVLNTGNSFLCTEKPYGDFVLEYEFKVAAELNSGVQIRSECFDTDKQIESAGKTIKIPAGRVHGYQIEIDPSKRAWTGGIYDEGRRGWLANLEKKPDAQAAFKQGEWNKIRVEARGDSLKTWLNGVPAAEIHDSMTLKGFIALQVHSSKQEGLEIRWRNLFIQDLDAK